jgi:hypothetical protein
MGPKLKICLLALSQPTQEKWPDWKYFICVFAIKFSLFTFPGRVVSSRYIPFYFPIFYAQYKRCVKSEHFHWLIPYSLHIFTGRKVSGIYLNNDIVLTMCMSTQVNDNGSYSVCVS